ncbi:hypothetical protein [Streptomyces sp. NPDC048527]|uniref:hypothetical protein n=1 Tax=Streptomyces sp. NPDC048527 TaxID=3365568 RepID=UPI00371B32FE
MAAALIIVAVAVRGLFCSAPLRSSSVFLVGLVAMTRFVRAEKKPAPAAAAVTLTLVVNPLRGRPVLSPAATHLIAAGRVWVRGGRPGGIKAVGGRAGQTV